MESPLEVDRKRSRGTPFRASSDDLRTYIVSTTNRVLVEASPRDTIWGVGMDRNDPNIERPSAWKGLNLLGFALMAARSRL